MGPDLNSCKTKSRHLKESLKSQASPSLLQSSTRKVRSSRLGRHCPGTKRRQVQGEEDKGKFLITLYFDNSLLITPILNNFSHWAVRQSPLILTQSVCSRLQFPWTMSPYFVFDINMWPCRVQYLNIYLFPSLNSQRDVWNSLWYNNAHRDKAVRWLKVQRCRK